MAMKDLFYISKSGEVRWNKFPEEPKQKVSDSNDYAWRNQWGPIIEHEWKEYDQALQAAKDSSVVCADQDAAWRMVFPQPEMQVMSNFKFDPKEDWVSYREGNQHWGQSAKSDSLHPFPSEQYEVEVETLHPFKSMQDKLNACQHPKCNCVMGRDAELNCDPKVAVITPKKEPMKQGITVDDVLKIKKALGPARISEIKVLENTVLPDNVIVVSSYLFKQIKSDQK